MRECTDTSGLRVVYARIVCGRITGRMGQNAAKIAGNRTLFGLLRAGTTGGAPLPPLEVECKPLWQPENVARAFGPIRVARTLDRMPLRKICLSAGEQISFIRRLARGF